jgi:hypothetical protein
LNHWQGVSGKQDSKIVSEIEYRDRPVGWQPGGASSCLRGVAGMSLEIEGFETTSGGCCKSSIGSGSKTEEWQRRMEALEPYL